ncbi:MAG: hypothetical protein WAK27_21090 [Candidatus Sulfotelmatobacter sp.]
MMKCKAACWFAVAAVWTCLATAQNSQSHLSSTQPPDPLKAVTKPLTEKSATPAQHKSSAAMPPVRRTNTNAELSHLERQKIVLSNDPKSVTPGARKNAVSAKTPAPTKTTETSAGTSAPIDYKYQKPAGGRQSDTPNARTPNSTTPRVTKKN